MNFIGSAESDLEFKVILDEAFVLACRAEHPLAGKRSVSWSELRPYDFITVAKSSGNRLLLDLALADVADRPVCVYEAPHLYAMFTQRKKQRVARATKAH